MKNSLKVILFSLFLTQVSIAQWTLVYTPSIAQSCYVLKFFDLNTGYHSGVLYNGSFNNIYKTTNGGLNWTAQNSGYTAQRFMAMHILHPDTVFICGNYGKILRTYNGGANWTQVYADTTLQFWGMKFLNSNTGLVTGSNGKVLKTTNKGDTWVTIPTSFSNAMQGMYFLNETTGYISGSPLVMKTTNAGLNWTNLNAPYVSGFETFTDVYFVNESTGWSSTNAGRIVMTTNGGTTWTEVYNVSGNAIWRLSFTDAQTGYGCSSTGIVVKTTNGGLNWGTQSTPLSENLYDIHFPSSGTGLTGYICSWSGKILKTVNGGGNFVGVTPISNETPNGFELKQNYPNPFNPNTKIKFNITKSDNVILVVYDILGNEVSKLVNEQLNPGTYEVNFDGSNIASGVYYYKLVTEVSSQIKKMILLK